MASYEITISVDVSVEDIPALYAAALARAKQEGQPDDNAVALLTDSDPEGRPDVPSCLMMLFDPGVSPDGTSINNTAVKREEYDEDEDMDAYEESLEEAK